MTDPNQNPYNHMNMGYQPQQQQMPAVINPQATYHSMYTEVGNNMENTTPNTANYNTPDLTTNGVCKKFIHGKCRQGQACPHPHDKSKIKACQKYQTKGDCPYGQRCNFSHDLKICQDFMREKCPKGEHCPYRHVYKSCPNFDMGYCHFGKQCKMKHIVRKLCWDYMYGYCEKGGRCPDHHPKIFVDEDFNNTKTLFEKLTKGDLEVIICRSCKVIGHKVNKCPKRMEIEPKDVFKCGLCGSSHMFIEDCNYIV